MVRSTTDRPIPTNKQACKRTLSAKNYSSTRGTEVQSRGGSVTGGMLEACRRPLPGLPSNLPAPLPVPLLRTLWPGPGRAVERGVNGSCVDPVRVGGGRDRVQEIPRDQTAGNGWCACTHLQVLLLPTRDSPTPRYGYFETIRLCL